MSNGIALSGSDTTIINNRVFSDLAEGDCVLLEFPNDVAAATTGKNNNAIITNAPSGKICNVTLRILRGSSDDKFLNGLFAQQNNNFAGMVLLQGSFIKKIGDGLGNVTPDTYVMQNGFFLRGVDARDNASGESEQSVSVWRLQFTKAPRGIG